MTRTLEHVRPKDAAAVKVTPMRLLWLGVIGSVLGSLAETVFMLLTRGHLYNRSSLLWGQFSLVWGAGAVLFTLVLRRYAQRGVWAVFLGGAFWGTVFELACSCLLELCFGVIYWDYSHLPLSIGGRINLFFSCFWGAAATVWIFWLLPWLSALLDRIPAQVLRWATVFLLAFLLLDITATCLALLRLDARQHGAEARNALERLLDQHWSDQRLFDRFPNMRYMENYYLEHPNFW